MQGDPYAEGTVAGGTPADYIEKASKEELKKEQPLPRPRPKKITPDDQEKLKKLVKKTTGYKSGGMIDRAAIKGKTRGKIC